MDRLARNLLSAQLLIFSVIAPMRLVDCYKHLMF